jgi:hypothetical protein
VVENYAPLTALRPTRAGRERAWGARDDRAPGWAMWWLWSRHVSRRLLERLRRLCTPAGDGARVRLVRQATASPLTTGLTDDEKASSR